MIYPHRHLVSLQYIWRLKDNRTGNRNSKYDLSEVEFTPLQPFLILLIRQENIVFGSGGLLQILTDSVKCTADRFWNCSGQGEFKYYVSNVNTAAAGEGGRVVCEAYFGEIIFSSTWCLMNKCSFKCQKP